MPSANEKPGSGECDYPRMCSLQHSPSASYGQKMITPLQSKILFGNFCDCDYKLVFASYKNRPLASFLAFFDAHFFCRSDSHFLFPSIYISLLLYLSPASLLCSRLLFSWLSSLAFFLFPSQSCTLFRPRSVSRVFFRSHDMMSSVLADSTPHRIGQNMIALTRLCIFLRHRRRDTRFGGSRYRLGDVSRLPYCENHEIVCSSSC